MRTKTPKFEVGNKVAYSVQFLKSIGESHGDMSQGRGEITAIKTYGGSLVLASIQWTGNHELPDKVATANLALVGPNMRFCNCG